MRLGSIITYVERLLLLPDGSEIETPLKSSSSQHRQMARLPPLGERGIEGREVIGVQRDPAGAGVVGDVVHGGGLGDRKDAGAAREKCQGDLAFGGAVL